MYKVTKDGKVLTVVSELRHCLMQSNGVPISTKDENAPGIIVGGKIYNLPGYVTELGSIVAGGVDNG